MLQPLRDPSKLFTRYRVNLRKIMDLDACVDPGETKILFDGKVERPIFMDISPENYYEAHVITNEWTEIIYLRRTYFVNPGWLTIKIRGFRSERQCWNMGSMYEIWVE